MVITTTTTIVALDTEEEAVLLSIPRPNGLKPVRVRACKMEYSYMMQPEATVVVSSYRRSAQVGLTYGSGGNGGGDSSSSSRRRRREIVLTSWC